MSEQLDLLGENPENEPTEDTTLEEEQPTKGISEPIQVVVTNRYLSLIHI